MGFAALTRVVVAGILATAACGILVANFVPASVSARRASVPVTEAAIGPFGMMMQAPLNLPVEQYEAH
jgi:hypothetical protein